MTFTERTNLLIERSKLSNEKKYILSNPPEIVKSSIEYLISFSNKPRDKPPRKQNAWSIYLKNYGVYLGGTYPNETFLMTGISVRAKVEWEKLKSSDYTKKYFK